MQKQALWDLAANVAYALRMRPPDYGRAIFGEPWTWNPRCVPSTELRIIRPPTTLQGLDALRHAVLPSLPAHPGVLGTLLGPARESRAYPYPAQADAQENREFPGESWLFLNGICTDENVLQLNAEYLHQLFGRPLTLLHNQTYGIVADLAECAVGKAWMLQTEAVRRLFPAFLAELKRPDVQRVVLIAHSQGTILAAVFIELLRRLLLHSGRRSIITPLIGDAAALAARLMRPLRASPRRPAARRLQVGAGPGNARLPEVDPDKLPEGLVAWFDWADDAAMGLEALTLAEVRKLEIYSFATCATQMRYILKDGAPWIEHFGNTNDLVARLGLFAARKGAGRTQLDGIRFRREDGWGHLLNAHYLDVLEHQWSQQWMRGEPFDAEAPHKGASSRLLTVYRQVHPQPR